MVLCSGKGSLLPSNKKIVIFLSHPRLQCIKVSQGGLISQLERYTTFSSAVRPSIREVVLDEVSLPIEETREQRRSRRAPSRERRQEAIPPTAGEGSDARCGTLGVVCWSIAHLPPIWYPRFFPDFPVIVMTRIIYSLRIARTDSTVEGTHRPTCADTKSMKSQLYIQS